MKSSVRKGPQPGHERRAGLLRELELHQIELETQNTALREAQVALEISRARYADLYDRAPVAYCSLDGGGVVREINLRGTKLLGRPRSWLVGQDLGTSFPVESRGALAELLSRCLGHGETVTAELALLSAEASHVEITSVANRDPLGAVDGCLVILTDVTGRRAAEVERARLLEEATSARARAELANRTKDDFLAVVSHELRAPAATMLLWAHIAKTNADPAARKQALEAIEVSSRAELKLLDDLLDLARSRTGKLRIDHGRVALAPLIESAMVAAAPLAAEAGVILKADVAPELGAVDGDEVRLGEVIGNLLANAIKFSPSGSRVLVHASARDGVATIEVRDHGAGIPSEVLPHVFELFHQGTLTAGERRLGLGVGLAVVKQLVEAHGGLVEASSRGRGRGTTMTVRLPVLREEPPAAAAPLAGAPPAHLGRSLDGLDVLVVEDNADMRLVVSEVLRFHGASVTVAASLAEGRARLRLALPQVLVSDILLPDGDGYALVRELRASEAKSGRHTMAVALTSLVWEHDRALAAGFDRHLPKPVEAEALITCLASLVLKPDRAHAPAS
jgi:PAS domain S-box-containing protein